MFPKHGNVVKMVPASQYDSMRAKGGVRAWKMNFYTTAGDQKTLNATKWVPQDKLDHYQKDLGGELAPDEKAGAPRKPESMLGKNMRSVVGAASPILATFGGIGGAAVAGPAGAVAGAAYGGFVGEGIARDAAGKPRSAGAELAAGAEQGAFELGGIGAGKLFEKIGAAALPKVIKGVNNYIGLKPTDLPKWGRTVEDSNEIARTVLNECGIKKTLPMQRDAIEAARALRNTQTERIVASPSGRLVDLDAKILDRAVELDKAVSLGEFPETTKGMIDANLEEMQRVAGEHGASATGKMTPAQMHAMRKSIQQQIKDWNPETTNPRQWFLQKIYHDLNDSIAQGLPEAEARAFRSNNKIQTNLIIAREAANKKIVGQELSPSHGIATRAKWAVGGAAAGAGYAAATGHPENMLKDAAFGAVAAGGARHLSDSPFADIATQRAIANAAPYIAKAAKKSPEGVRVVQGILDAIRSRDSQQ
jgi:hypothetical protein